jgi:putative spermidine/putrescine transport system ATP-binding protein
VRTQLRAEIRSLQQRLGITTLFVTHDQSEALSIADRVGVMNAGRLEQIDTPENVYHRPTSEFAADFVGAMNRIPGRLGDAGDVQVMGQRLKVNNPDGYQAGAVIEALVRPEAIGVIPDAAGTGEIIQATFLGSTVRLEIKLDDGNTILAEQAGTGGNAAVGARVGLKILAESVTVAETVAVDEAVTGAERVDVVADGPAG